MAPIQIFTILILFLGAFVPTGAVARALPQPRECSSIPLTGEVKEGQEWSAGIGEGWIFRLAPIQPSGRGYSGWDLVVNRAEDASYPDALLVATPPYGSLNEREIGTTYGLRAQDAIAWSPRRFHFLTSTKDWQQARELYRDLMAVQVGKQAVKQAGKAAGAGKPEDSRNGSFQSAIAAKLLAMLSDPGKMGSGVFSVLDARLIAGAGDPPAYAQQWAAHLSDVPHTIEQSGSLAGVSPSWRGELRWIRFAVTLTLPAGWKLPQGLRSGEATCAE